MSQNKTDVAITALKLVLGIVVIVQASILGFDTRAINAFARTGLPNIIRLGLVWSEIAAGILFLIPPALVFGAWLLVAVFLGAIIIHLAHGFFDVGGLLVYGMAAIVVMVHQKNRLTTTRDLYAK